MSTQSSSESRGGPYRKPRPDVFTLMLVISLLAIILGIVFLYFEMKDYDFKLKGGPSALLAPAGSFQCSTQSPSPSGRGPG
ncbi:MAG: hypothetical protein ABSG68_05495 [Thermoguttaceae bacterium]